MKRTLFATLSVLMIAALFVGGCDKKSSTSPSDQKPPIPILTWSTPGVDTTSCSLQAAGYVGQVQVMTSLTNAFAALPGTNNNGVWTWQLPPQSGVTYTLTGQYEQDGQYHWSLKANGTDTGTNVTYNNFTLMEGTTNSTATSGSLTIYDDSSPNTPVIATIFTFTVPSANNINASMEVYNGGSKYAKVDITSTASAGGSVSVYPWTGSAYSATTIYHATWATSGGPVTCS